MKQLIQDVEVQFHDCVFDPSDASDSTIERMANEVIDLLKSFGVNVDLYNEMHINNEITYDGHITGHVTFYDNNSGHMINLNDAVFSVATGELLEYTHFDMF